MNEFENEHTNENQVEATEAIVDDTPRFNLKRMCDKCFHILAEDEVIFGFALEDGYGFKRGFKGHQECVEEMSNIISSIYQIVERPKEG